MQNPKTKQNERVIGHPITAEALNLQWRIQKARFPNDDIQVLAFAIAMDETSTEGKTMKRHNCSIGLVNVSKKIYLSDKGRETFMLLPVLTIPDEYRSKKDTYWRKMKLRLFHYALDKAIVQPLRRAFCDGVMWQNPRTKNLTRVILVPFLIIQDHAAVQTVISHS